MKAGNTVHCSEEEGDKDKKVQGGGELAIEKLLGMQINPGLPEFISDRLLKLVLDLRLRAKDVSFVMIYTPTKIDDTSKNMFWVALEIALEDTPFYEQLFVPMDGNARSKLGATATKYFVPTARKYSTRAPIDLCCHPRSSSGDYIHQHP